MTLEEYSELKAIADLNKIRIIHYRRHGGINHVKIFDGMADEILHTAVYHRAKRFINEIILGMDGDEMRKCPCGSGLECSWQKDGNGIPLALTCPKCHVEKMAKYRPEILRPYTEADVDEQIEPDHEEHPREAIARSREHDFREYQEDLRREEEGR